MGRTVNCVHLSGSATSILPRGLTNSFPDVEDGGQDTLAANPADSSQHRFSLLKPMASSLNIPSSCLRPRLLTSDSSETHNVQPLHKIDDFPKGMIEKSVSQEQPLANPLPTAGDDSGSCMFQKRWSLDDHPGAYKPKKASSEASTVFKRHSDKNVQGKGESAKEKPGPRPGVPDIVPGQVSAARSRYLAAFNEPPSKEFLLSPTSVLDPRTVAPSFPCSSISSDSPASSSSQTSLKDPDADFDPKDKNFMLDVPERSSLDSAKPKDAKETAVVKQLQEEASWLQSELIAARRLLTFLEVRNYRGSDNVDLNNGCLVEKARRSITFPPMSTISTTSSNELLHAVEEQMQMASRGAALKTLLNEMEEEIKSINGLLQSEQHKNSELAQGLPSTPSPSFPRSASSGPVLTKCVDTPDTSLPAPPTLPLPLAPSATITATSSGSQQFNLHPLTKAIPLARSMTQVPENSSRIAVAFQRSATVPTQTLDTSHVHFPFHSSLHSTSEALASSRSTRKKNLVHRIIHSKKLHHFFRRAKFWSSSARNSARGSFNVELPGSHRTDLYIPRTRFSRGRPSASGPLPRMLVMQDESKAQETWQARQHRQLQWRQSWMPQAQKAGGSETQQDQWPFGGLASGPLSERQIELGFHPQCDWPKLAPGLGRAISGPIHGPWRHEAKRYSKAYRGCASSATKSRKQLESLALVTITEQKVVE